MTKKPKLLLVVFLVALPFYLAPKQAAAICTSCSMVRSANEDTREFSWEEHRETAEWINEEFMDWEEFLVHWLMPRFPPIWVKMAEQMTVTAMHQAFIIGTFFDASHQLKVQRVLHRKTAEAHRDYQPSTEVCKFGTIIRGLNDVSYVAEANSFVLNRRLLDRQLGNVNISAAEGEHIDRSNRLAQFRDRYCDLSDNNNGYNLLCLKKGAPASTANRDIDYSWTIDHPYTLESRLTDSPDTDEIEQDIYALADNLYGHRTLPRVPETIFTQEVNQPRILDVRAVAAKRNVAQSSFATIAGLKARGADALATSTMPFVHKLLEQFGISSTEITALLDNADEPSYYAQMEILTKKIYQHPGFYVNLYEKPENVDRQKVVLQAIGLMQDYDTFESYMRTEMMLSIILELEVIKLQQDIQNQIYRLRPVEAG